MFFCCGTELIYPCSNGVFAGLECDSRIGFKLLYRYHYRDTDNTGTGEEDENVGKTRAMCGEGRDKVDEALGSRDYKEIDRCTEEEGYLPM